MNTTLIKKEQIAEGTMMFHFAKPEGFEYLSGQSIDLFIPNLTEPDPEGNKRAFSLVSAPHEKDIAIATRLRDTGFKRALKNMPEGSELLLEGAFGDMTLHENATRPAVFLCGGIGITPFRSMILDAVERNLPHTIVLLYSNRRPEDAPFLEELMAIGKQHANITVVPTMTEKEKSAQPWNGETGYIDGGMIGRHVSLSANPLFYMAGPAPMVSAMKKTLSAMGISKDDIRLEEFSGY